MPLEIDRNGITNMQEACRLPENLIRSIAGYLERHYVEDWQKTSYVLKESSVRPEIDRRGEREPFRTSCVREAMLPCAAVPKSRETSLPEWLKQADAGFSETLLKLIDASGHKDSTIYKKAHVSKQHFSKIRNNPNYRPNKETAIAFALALELDVIQTNDLIGRAGYTLSNSSKFDLIIRYFIENKTYDIVQINMALYEFDQTLLAM